MPIFLENYLKNIEINILIQKKGIFCYPLQVALGKQLNIKVTMNIFKTQILFGLNIIILIIRS